VSRASAEQIRVLIVDLLADDLAALGIEPAVVADGFDLRAGGVIDSLGFLELIAGLEAELGVELDFEDIDPAQLTVVGPLAAYVSGQVAPAAAPEGAVVLGS
jgi:acyl carrier protein